MRRRATSRARPLGVGKRPRRVEPLGAGVLLALDAARRDTATGAAPSRRRRSWLRPGDVAEPPGRRGGELVEDLARRLASRRPPRCPSARPSAREDLPVGQRDAGRVERLAHERRRGARSSSSCPSFSGHCGGRQHDVGERARSRSGGRRPGTTTSSALRSAGREALGVGLRDDRVRGDDPDGLHPAVLERVDELGRGEARRRARCRARRPGCPTAAASPRGRSGVGDGAVAGQQRREAAGLAPAHRVRLAGERQRPGARPADVAGRQAEVDAARGSSACRRVDWFAPIDQSAIARGARRRTRRAASTIVVRRHAADLRPRARAATRPRRRQRVARRPRCGARRTLRSTQALARRSRASIALSSGEVACPAAPAGAGRRPRRCRCGAGRRRSTVAPSAWRSRIARPDDRVAGGRVRAEQQHAVGLRDVGVGRRRPVGAERARVAGHRARHAQPRVRVDVVGAEEALGELVDGVVVLGQQLAGDVERDRVRAVLGRRSRAGARASAGIASPPASPRASARRRLARSSGTVARSGACDGVGQAQRLAARRAAVDRVERVAARPSSAGRPSHLGDQPAADPAVGAGRADVACSRRLAGARPRGRTHSSPSRSTTSYVATPPVAAADRLARAQVEAPAVQRAGHAAVGDDAVGQRAARRAGRRRRSRRSRRPVRKTAMRRPSTVRAAALEQRHVVGAADAVDPSLTAQLPRLADRDGSASVSSSANCFGCTGSWRSRHGSGSAAALAIAKRSRSARLLARVEHRLAHRVDARRARRSRRCARGTRRSRGSAAGRRARAAAPPRSSRPSRAGRPCAPCAPAAPPT